MAKTNPNKDEGLMLKIPAEGKKTKVPIEGNWYPQHSGPTSRANSAGKVNTKIPSPMAYNSVTDQFRGYAVMAR